MNKTLKRKVIVHLRKLGNRKIKPHFTDRGLCSELGFSIPELTNIVSTVAWYTKDWPKYSNNFSYPIHCSKLGAERKYTSLLYKGNMWDARTTYGKNRLELCLYIADVLEQELKEDESNN